MKYLIKLFFLLFFLKSNLLSAQTQSILQVLDVDGYIIEYKTEASSTGGNKPSYRNIITLSGTPANNSSILKAELNFTVDSRYNINKPTYNENTRIASAWLPMSEFDKYFNMCMHKLNYVRAMFRYQSQLKTNSLSVEIFGNMKK